MASLIQHYTRPAGPGMYATYRAVLRDGREVTIDTQYGTVQPHAMHVSDCPQRTRIGGRCTCPANADIMAVNADLIVEARALGAAESAAAAERAAVPASPTRRQPERSRSDGWCDRCESYCYGDCIASNG